MDESQAARVLNAIVYSADNQQTSKEVTSKELTSKELQSEIRKMKKYLQSQKQRGVDEETAIRSLMMSSILYESNDCSIGLGDFVFFTLQIILIAEISRNPFFVFGSILLILVGLFITICILTTTHSPLPGKCSTGGVLFGHLEDNSYNLFPPSTAHLHRLVPGGLRGDVPVRRRENRRNKLEDDLHLAAVSLPWTLMLSPALRS